MENIILQLFRKSPARPYSVKEISKMVDRRRYHVEPLWARAFLNRLNFQGHITKTQEGYYTANSL